jgi:hypothetical protein
MVLVREVNCIRELFNNYGRMTNTEALGNYGLLNPHTMSDTVSLRNELFNLSSAISLDATRFTWWKERGFELVEAVARRNHKFELQLERLLNYARNRAKTGDDFVDWSLAVEDIGNIPIPLRIWGFMTLYSAEEFSNFVRLPLEEQSRAMYELVYLFDRESPVVKKHQRSRYVRWLELMQTAICLRRARYPNVQISEDPEYDLKNVTPDKYFYVLPS